MEEGEVFRLVDLFAQLLSAVDEIDLEQVVDRREERKRATGRQQCEQVNGR